MRQNGQYSPLSNGLVGIFHGLDLLFGSQAELATHAISANLPPLLGGRLCDGASSSRLSAAAAAWPLAARAQQRKVPTIGVLVVGAPGSEQFWRLFRDVMREMGYVEGRSVRYEFRSDQGQMGRLPELAAELVRLNVDLIVTWFTPAALAAKAATRDIPIVMALAGDPVANGLVDSLNRPGGNVTGMSGVNAELGGKSVELIREMLPSAHRISALANAPDPFSKPFLEQIGWRQSHRDRDRRKNASRRGA